MSQTVSQIDIKQHLIGWLKYELNRYLKDLDALPADKLNAVPMGTARTPLSFTAECIGYNKAFTTLFCGETFTPPSEEERKAFYASIDSLEKAKTMLTASTNEVIEAISQLNEADLNREVEAPWGGPITLINLGYAASTHLQYHDGQLNYIQTLYGDNDIHWF